MMFTVLCIERHIALYEAQFPDDDRPRKALEAARELHTSHHLQYTRYPPEYIEKMEAAFDAQKEAVGDYVNWTATDLDHLNEAASHIAEASGLCLQAVIQNDQSSGHIASLARHSVVRAVAEIGRAHV